MSQKDDLIARLRSRPKDFTIRELDSLMNKCGCEKSNSGKTSGSRIAYVHVKTQLVYKTHSPHPQPVLKSYVIDDVLEFLMKVGEI